VYVSSSRLDGPQTLYVRFGEEKILLLCWESIHDSSVAELVPHIDIDFRNYLISEWYCSSLVSWPIVDIDNGTSSYRARSPLSSKRRRFCCWLQREGNKKLKFTSVCFPRR